jgi:hypothetical protein
MDCALGDERVTGTGASDLLIEEVGSWAGVRVEDSWEGIPVFRLGHRQLGHLHLSSGGACFADIATSSSGWATVPIRTAADLREALELFRASYEGRGRVAA